MLLFTGVSSTTLGISIDFSGNFISSKVVVSSSDGMLHFKIGSSFGFSLGSGFGSSCFGASSFTSGTTLAKSSKMLSFGFGFNFLLTFSLTLSAFNLARPRFNVLG
ncbi:MAG: hypothetical protein L6V91_08930 [Bacilli bacterium]|nr:MAG: hypothetical protein L6V91_08930 [Bacilli bacterium]